MTKIEALKSESYVSKDFRYEYTLVYADGRWDVDCWITTTDENHWSKSFGNESKARKEFERWRNM